MNTNRSALTEYLIFVLILVMATFLAVYFLQAFLPVWAALVIGGAVASPIGYFLAAR